MATDSRIILYISSYNLFSKDNFKTLAKQTRCGATKHTKLCLKITNVFLDTEHRSIMNENILIAWKVSVFAVFLVPIFSHSDWMRRYTPYDHFLRID